MVYSHRHGPHGHGPGYFHRGGHVAFVPGRRRFWRAALNDGLYDDIYVAPPVKREIIVQQPAPGHHHHGKHYLMLIIFLFVMVCIALFASLRR